MHKSSLLICVLALATVACSSKNDFSPTAGMSGKDIFAQVCTECHQPVGEYVMEISAEMKDADRIANKVLSGSMMMPAFPNIQGASAKALGEYVVANSKVK